MDKKVEFKRLLVIIVMYFLLVFVVLMLHGGYVNAEKKKTIYVVSKVVGGNARDQKYSYNKNGLIKSVNNCKWGYNKDGLLISKVSKSKTGDIETKTSYEYDKKNRIVKEIYSNYVEFGGFGIIYNYEYDKENRIIKETLKDVETGKITTKIKYNYNKKGYLIKEKWTGNGKRTVKYKYDEYGHKINDQLYNYKNEYVDDRLVKRLINDDSTDQNGSEFYIYKYKKITVPISKLKVIEKQQREILDDY